ncbi:MAG: hypothetical protein GEU98_08380 [Pseudonocardiaceae bacterium]|nr:hypothetical protein [Pseudonocardiaceae bacterium]
MRVVRGIACALLLGVVALLVAPAPSMAQPEHVVTAVRADVHHAQDDTAPPGPRIDPDDNAQADSDLAQRKIVIGCIAAGLVLIVLYGRHVRKKRRKQRGN